MYIRGGFVEVKNGVVGKAYQSTRRHFSSRIFSHVPQLKRIRFGNPKSSSMLSWSQAFVFGSAET